MPKITKLVSHFVQVFVELYTENEVLRKTYDDILFVGNTDEIIKWAEQTLTGSRTIMPLTEAILATVDWNDVRSELKEWYDDNVCGVCKVYCEAEYCDKHDEDLCEVCHKEKDDECECDRCPSCNDETGGKNWCNSRSCCKCEEITFCWRCVSEQEEQSYCSHEWEGHYICGKCEEH